MPAATSHAVFLSYASQDAEAARRMCDALRAAGVEVWLDQEGGLVGGDAWDRKIRGQIASCALFIPIVSANTQARTEGYFRLEWKLAAQRTHMISERTAFLLPVVIDATRDAEADVPVEFRAVQWTRLPGGETPEKFCERVKNLLSPESDVGRGRRNPSSNEANAPTAGIGDPALPSKRPWGLIAAAVGLVAAAVVFLLLRPSPPAAEPAASRSAPPAALVTSAAPAKSIAVLPFANLSAEAENAFFADGMHDDLITALAKVRDLKVISRTSVMPYKTGERNLRKIAAELGVATVLEGSVQRAGNRVRINVQLIDARTDGHLWAETYNQELTDVFSIQASLTQEIATALKASLTVGERTLLARRPTENQAAYDLYLRARVLEQNLAGNSSREEYERVLGLFDQAAALDPGFALAHAQASMLNGLMFWFTQLDPTPARRALALAGLEAAQRLAPGSPEVLMAQGFFEYSCNNDWVKALVHYQAAEAGLPNEAQLHYRIAIAHRRLGDMPAALARLERAADLNPHDASGITALIGTNHMVHRYRQVVALAERYRSLVVTDATAQRHRIDAQFQLDGDLVGYRRNWAARPPTPSDPHGLGKTYLLAFTFGDLAAADRVLTDPRLETVSGSGGVVGEPVTLHRAQIAWLQGRPEDARRLADEAIAYYRGRQWSARQQPVVQMDLARAEALAGRKEVALREAAAAMAAQIKLDALTAADLRYVYGRLLVTCDRRAEALDVLRDYIGGFGLRTPNEIRLDPIWSRLKDDPRFEEILKSAKAL